MGSFVGWSLSHKDNDECGKCGMKEDKEKKGCCKDEHKEIKIKAEHQKGGVQDNVAKIFFSPILIEPFPNFEFTFTAVTKFTYTNFHPPPNVAPIKLHILYGVFLI